MRHSPSPGGRLIELPGATATAFPACPRLWLFNCVFEVEDAEGVLDAVPTLDREFAALGVERWSVYVDDTAPGVGEALRAAGFRPISLALVMAGYTAELDLEPRGGLELAGKPTWEMVAACNDRAYGVAASDGVGPVLRGIDDPACHLYVAVERGEPISCAITREQDGDCYMWFTATVPEARRRGVALALVRHAFAEARARGCETACGESTPMAEGIYVAVGGVRLGTSRTWVISAGH